MNKQNIFNDYIKLQLKRSYMQNRKENQRKINQRNMVFMNKFYIQQYIKQKFYYFQNLTTKSISHQTVRLFKLLLQKQDLGPGSQATLHFLGHSIHLNINIITTMHQSKPQQTQLKEELSKFINLLQSNFSSDTQNQPQGQTCNRYPLTKKLSIILSASQPDHSSLERENSNLSVGKSFEIEQKSLEIAVSRNSLINTLMATSLNSFQIKLINKIRQYTDQQDQEQRRQNVKICELKKQLQVYKKTNEEMLKVLKIVEKQQKKNWDAYNLTIQKYESLLQKNKQIQAQLNQAKQNVNSLQKDNNFIKKLIYHANQNYQALERKCKRLEVREKSSETTERKGIKQSSTDHLLKSSKTKKNGHSPTHSSIIRAHSPQDFQLIYRKMIIQILKHKGRSQQQLY